MTPFIIRPHLSEATFAKSLTMNGVATPQETSSVVFLVYWRWEDEPTMKPEYLGSGVPGNSLRVPFELKGRDVRFFLVSQTEDGQRSVANITEAEQVVFSSPARVYSGEETVEAGEDLAAFDLIHIYNDGGTSKARKADATDATKPARAFVVEAAVAGGSLVNGSQVRLFFGGNIITRVGKGWTPGTVLYLSEASGDITTTAPTGAGKVVQVIGTAITDETAIFEPDEPVTLT